MVAILPIDSCKTDKRSAAVGDADASPTPTPSSTARDERRLAIELENACKESYANVSPRINSPTKRSSDIDLVFQVVFSHALRVSSRQENIEQLLPIAFGAFRKNDVHSASSCLLL